MQKFILSIYLSALVLLLCPDSNSLVGIGPKPGVEKVEDRQDLPAIRAILIGQSQAVFVRLTKHSDIYDIPRNSPQSSPSPP